MMELLKEVKKKKKVLQCICMKKESIVYQSSNVMFCNVLLISTQQLPKYANQDIYI